MFARVAVGVAALVQMTMAVGFCTLDVKICPDGTALSRNPDKQCAFPPCPAPADKYAGDWVLTRTFGGPELGEIPLPTGQLFPLTVKRSAEDAYGFSVRVTNTLWNTVRLTGETLDAFDGIEAGMVATTLMAAFAPGHAELEAYLGNALATAYKMIVTPEGTLIMVGPTAEMHFVRVL